MFPPEKKSRNITFPALDERQFKSAKSHFKDQLINLFGGQFRMTFGNDEVFEAYFGVPFLMHVTSSESSIRE
jgi:hypothetical protein